MTTNRTNREMATMTSLDDEWTERTMVEPRARRRVLREMRRREAALSLAMRISAVIDGMLVCDLYGELAAAAEVR